MRRLGREESEKHDAKDEVRLVFLSQCQFCRRTEGKLVFKERKQALQVLLVAIVEMLWCCDSSRSTEK